jgi:hypothetical protein
VSAPQDILFPLGGMFGMSGIRLIGHGGCQSQTRSKRRPFNQVSLRVLWGNGQRKWACADQRAVKTVAFDERNFQR